MFIFAGLGAAAIALIVGTYSGAARAAYLRIYNKTHATTLPAGWIEEMVWWVDQRYNKGRLDYFGIEHLQMRIGVWHALREPQTDTNLEKLRIRALHRSTFALILGAFAYICWLIFWFSVFLRVSLPL